MIDEITQYAKDVVDGKYVVCEANYLACKRHLDDVERSKSDEYKYYFNVKEAQRIIEYAECLRIADKGGMKVKLYPFQKFIVGSLMGWLCKDDDSWRFRLSNVSFAKKNGKSFLSGILLSYALACCKEQYSKYYIVANRRKEARICYEEITKFIQMDKNLMKIFKIFDYKSELKCTATNNILEVLSREKKLDGIKGVFSVIDEMHLIDSLDTFNALKFGQSTLYETMVSIISTAGTDLSYPYYKIYLMSKKILAKEITDERMFIFICELDKDDSYEDKSVYIKANPSFELKDIDEVYADYLRFKEIGGSEFTKFITKRLNLFVAGGDSENYLTADIVEKMQTNKTIADFKGRECVIGLDMSSLSDLTSTTFLFKDFLPNNVENYFIKSHSFLPRVAYNRFVKKDKNWIDYVNEGSLTVTDAVGGEALDYKKVITYIKDIIDTYKLKPIILCYDSNNIGGILQDIDETLRLDGMPIRQSMLNLTEPTVMFKVLAKNGQVQFEASKLYEFCLNNAVIVQDFGENKCCKVDKRQVDRKIDAIDATIDAMKFALTMKKPKKRPDYSKIYEAIDKF